MDFNYFAATQPFHLMPALSALSAPPHSQSSAPSSRDYTSTSPSDFNNYAPFHFDTTTAAAFDAKLAPSADIIDFAAQDRMLDFEADAIRATRSSSEEKDSLTPAQSRRKEQNRAAQRAFRERKERHVKDLEQKLNGLEESSQALTTENERLRAELQRISTENEILKATSSHAAGGSGLATPHSITVGHMNYNPQEFYSVLQSSGGRGSGTGTNHSSPGSNDGAGSLPSHRVVISEKTGERMLGAGEAWDTIQAHPLFRKGLLDVGDVCQRLKKKAACDGQGPVFEERDVREAIEASASSGNDELI
ncbi:MAG: hypothetical protein M1814_005208 [Vezdaea aestivalis]|nr:MAG: hypothetical protein M1814_005208 [Vezdaea aestivalis]